MILRIAAASALLTLVLAHGGHDQQPIPADADWTVRHMSEEHHITSFDAGSFFNLHDYDGSNEWTLDDILKTYGLRQSPPTTSPTTRKRKRQEYTIGTAQGLTLPDFGWGPGHHGDDEYEYEIHHFEKFHGDDATEEELNHPEDIAHFQKHEMLEQQAERQEAMDRMRIVEANIPMKFRRNG
ncbi:hypothetical protein LTR54_010796 [Friedmanniomyces endolithicus]|nr:hypothetical protein LTR54_010796 [Friedmanniomyces endolithicus]